VVYFDLPAVLPNFESAPESYFVAPDFHLVSRDVATLRLSVEGQAGSRAYGNLTGDAGSGR
jgi:hypothetical protein